MMAEFVLIPRNYWRLVAVVASVFGALFVLSEWSSPDPMLLGRLPSVFFFHLQQEEYIFSKINIV
jgi:hypothetical protein